MKLPSLSKPRKPRLTIPANMPMVGALGPTGRKPKKPVDDESPRHERGESMSEMVKEYGPRKAKAKAKRR